MVIKEIVCGTCAGEDVYSNLIVCNQCHNGAEHIYCLHNDERSEIDAELRHREDWKCQVCVPREGTNKLVQDDAEVAARRKRGRPSGSLRSCDSIKGSKIKTRFSRAGKSEASSVHLLAERYQVPSTSSLMKKPRDSPLSEAVPSKTIKKSKIKSLNEIVCSIPKRSSGETLFSGPSFSNIGAAKSSGQLGHRLQASNHNNHKEPNCPSLMKTNENQQGEQTTKAANSMSIHKLSVPSASNEGTCLRDSVQVEAAFLSRDVIVPEAFSSWIGKFQIHSSEGIQRTLDGIQAHLSNCSSPLVVKMVASLPKIIILEELPRPRLWPTQFAHGRVTEDNIGLFFFPRDNHRYLCYKQFINHVMETDLALRANLDGTELLIYPSSILPKNSQLWNQMFYLWGVFRGRKADNSATTPLPVSNSLELDNGEAAKGLPFDLNAYPEDGDDVKIVDKIPTFDLNAYPEDVDDVKIVEKIPGLDLNAYPQDEDCMEIVYENPETGGKGGSRDRVLVVGENSERGNGCGSVKVENADVEVPSTSLPIAPNSTILDQNDWKGVDDLMFFSKGKF